MPVLAAEWDGDVERVAWIAQDEPPTFIARADALERVARNAGNYVGDGAAIVRDALEGGPAADRVDCMIDGSNGGFMRINVRDFERYLSGDFEPGAPDGGAAMIAAAADPEVAAALIQVTAERLPDPDLPALRDAADALFDSPSDVELILARVRDAIVACRPLYGTAPGQNMGIVLNAIVRAATARGAPAPPKVAPRRTPGKLPKLTGEEHFAHALDAARFPLSLGWDGTSDRVAFVEPAGNTVAVRYVSRDDATKRMLELAQQAKTPQIAAACRTEATMIAQGPRPNRVDCVILGWGGQALIYLVPDVLRATVLEAEEGDEEERRALLTQGLDVPRMRAFLTSRGLVNAGTSDPEVVIASWHKGRSGAKGLVDDAARRESIAWLEERGYSHFAFDLRPRTGKEN
jgi:hypothetical protein